MSSLPISEYALLSDRHSAALVSRGGSIDWLCFPRFDSTSVFASILGSSAGNWSICPRGQFESTRRYLPASMVLETTFTAETGTAVLTDGMEVGDSPDPHRLGENAPHTLLRSITCTSGNLTLEVQYRPRPEYGLIVPLMARADSAVLATGGSGRLLLSAPELLSAEQGKVGLGEVTGSFDLAEGESLHFALQHSMLGSPGPVPYSQDQIKRSLDTTLQAWQQWSELHQSYDGPWRRLVHRSGLVLEALSYQPTGAIIAAPTTSLPEQIGGERNWDYRYSWARDASFTMEALWVAACPDEASEFFGFITAAAAHSRPDRHLQIMFGIRGEHDLSERVLPQLEGWRGSRPVRVGNGAWDQAQLDVYGEILDAAFRLRRQLGELDPGIGGFLAGLADTAASQWRQKDNGIWEIRGAPQHFLYSKLMCWVALDRAVKLAGQLRATDRVEEWTDTAQEIREAILENGWNSEAGAFTQHFDTAELDAAALMLPIVGFLPASDPRILSTLDAIEESLTDSRGLVLRYRTDTGIDGLAGGEGSFLLCTFWLAQVLAMAGRVERAREVFERARGYVNDVGLLAEEVDSATGEQLGNFPQAFSHVGLVNAAWSIDQAERRRKRSH
jgi:alpha,alpha-trehalase